MIGYRSERACSGHVKLARRMQITDKVGAVFVDVAVQAELALPLHKGNF